MQLNPQTSRILATGAAAAAVALLLFFPGHSSAQQRSSTMEFAPQSRPTPVIDPIFVAPTPTAASINCNPSTITGGYTCKCDTSGGCTYLDIMCTHVDGNYYTCEDDESVN